MISQLPLGSLSASLLAVVQAVMMQFRSHPRIPRKNNFIASLDVRDAPSSPCCPNPAPPGLEITGKGPATPLLRTRLVSECVCRRGPQHHTLADKGHLSLSLSLSLRLAVGEQATTRGRFQVLTHGYGATHH